jgi:hypothetical protein
MPMTFDPRISDLVIARNLLRTASRDVPTHTPAEKALRAAILATEVAWQQLEDYPDVHPRLEDLP